MDNRKHMRTEKKTAVKNSFGRLLATGIFVLIQVAWLAYLLLYFYRDYAWISLLSTFIAIILVLCIAGGIYWFMQSSSSKQPIRQSIPAATSTVKEMPNDSVTLQQQDTVSGSNLQTREPIQSQPAETPLQ